MAENFKAVFEQINYLSAKVKDIEGPLTNKIADLQHSVQTYDVEIDRTQQINKELLMRLEATFKSGS